MPAWEGVSSNSPKDSVSLAQTRWTLVSVSVRWLLGSEELRLAEEEVVVVVQKVCSFLSLSVRSGRRLRQYLYLLLSSSALASHLRIVHLAVVRSPRELTLAHRRHHHHLLLLLCHYCYGFGSLKVLAVQDP